MQKSRYKDNIYYYFEYACKECNNERNKKFRTNNPDKLAIYKEKAHAKYLESIRYKPKRILKTEHEKKVTQLQGILRYNKNNPDKVKARQFMANEILPGRIKRQPCIICGKKNAEGHHEDYSKPLKITWLCKIHHVAYHQGKLPILTPPKTLDLEIFNT